MTTYVKPVESLASTDDDDDGLIHLVCPRFPARAYCGHPFGDDGEWIESGDDPDDCIVCVELQRKCCPMCGDESCG